MKCWSWQYTIAPELAFLCVHLSPAFLKVILRQWCLSAHQKSPTWNHFNPWGPKSVLLNRAAQKNRLRGWWKISRLRLCSLRLVKTRSKGPCIRMPQLWSITLNEHGNSAWGRWEAKKKSFSTNKCQGLRCHWGSKYREVRKNSDEAEECVFVSIWNLSTGGCVLEIQNPQAHNMLPPCVKRWRAIE